MVGAGHGGPRGNKRPRPPSNIDDDNAKCSMHNTMRHSTLECWEIKKHIKQFCEKMQQPRQDGTPSRQQEGNRKSTHRRRKT
jgi:hypothetical protein